MLLVNLKTNNDGIGFETITLIRLSGRTGPPKPCGRLSILTDDWRRYEYINTPQVPPLSPPSLHKGIRLHQLAPSLDRHRITTRDRGRSQGSIRCDVLLQPEGEDYDKPRPVKRIAGLRVALPMELALQAESHCLQVRFRTDISSIFEGAIVMGLIHDLPRHPPPDQKAKLLMTGRHCQRGQTLARQG